MTKLASAGRVWLALALLALLAAGYPPGWQGRTALPLTGTATYYNPGVMQAVLAYRQSIGQLAPCPECVGYVALLRAGDIGRKVWLQYGNDVIGPVLVIDCATPWDYARLSGWWAADVSWEIAQRWHMRGGLTVTVTENDPHGAPIQTAIPASNGQRDLPTPASQQHPLAATPQAIQPDSGAPSDHNGLPGPGAHDPGERQSDHPDLCANRCGHTPGQHAHIHRAESAIDDSLLY